jgi:hypothetical protein
VKGDADFERPALAHGRDPSGTIDLDPSDFAALLVNSVHFSFSLIKVI